MTAAAVLQHDHRLFENSDPREVQISQLELTPSGDDFSAIHERMQDYIDKEILSCVNTLVMRGTDIVDMKCFGYQDIQAQKPLTEHSIFRIFSNTKIVTSVAAMMLFEEGRFKLDDPLEKYLPQLANRQMLEPDAEQAADTQPCPTKPEVRHLMSHSAGLSYGFVEPNSVIDRMYNERKINDPGETLATMVDRLADVPLAYEPGKGWRYSVATDVLARLVEVLSGQTFDAFLKARIFTPLGMTDTDFYVPADKRDRFCKMYMPKDFFNPMAGGLNDATGAMTGSDYEVPPVQLSGGAGLCSTLGDYTTFIRMIVNGGQWNGARILQRETLELMRTNQLGEGVGVRFPMWAMPGTTFGLGFALKNEPAEGEPATAAGEYHWGGIAGTHSWMSPNHGITGICMTQLMPGFWHPFSHEFKRLAYAATSPGI